jgi:hypothetical protein
MTHKVSRNGQSQQSGSVRKEKMANSALLAAVSILSASLGVTAAQSAAEVTAADGSSTHGFNTRLAIDFDGNKKPKLQSNQEKPVSKGFVYGKRPDQFSPPSPSGPQAKPKR